MAVTLLVGDVRAKLLELPERSVHCVVTSPPYWALRDYGVAGQMGSEATPEEHVAAMVGVFRDVRRVLRDDGVCFVNYGDTYSSSVNGSKHAEPGEERVDDDDDRAFRNKPMDTTAVVAAGNLVGIPWRFALAMQADGWILRSCIVWAKSSCMPESLAGWRWERCRVKVEKSKRHNGSRSEDAVGAAQGMTLSRVGREDPDGNAAKWRDCPGCSKCEANGGLVLRRGSWRPTSAHEFIFMFAKTMGYYCDDVAAREPASESYRKDKRPHGVLRQKFYEGSKYVQAGMVEKHDGDVPTEARPAFRNARNVWSLRPEPFPEAHFATFPPDLPRRCIEAGTSAKGCCPTCGSPWARVTSTVGCNGSGDTGKTAAKREAGLRTAFSSAERSTAEVTTHGWRATCACPAHEPIPCMVLDPFAGAGTTLMVATQMGRDSIGIELNPEYASLARKRIHGKAGLFA